MKLIPKDIAEKIYDYLIEHGGATSRIMRDGGDAEKDSFVFHASEQGITEYRCVNKLGFGGKFWNNADKWYVTCYKEDETPERKKIIEQINKFLTELKEDFYKNRCGLCGSAKIEKQDNAGWDIDPEGEEDQHLETCMSCYAYRYRIDRLDIGKPLRIYYGSWIKEE